MLGEMRFERGASRKPKGFEFRDASPTAPIATVIVKTDVLSVKGNGPGWTHTLDEAQQRRVGIRLHLGDVAWCAAAARTSGTPPSSIRFDHADKFDGQASAPPPRICPIYYTP